MNIKIVYFAYLIPDKWSEIVKEQLDSLKKLSLYNDAANIYMTVISDNTELEKLKILLKESYSKVEIKNVFNNNLYEYPGLKTIYQIAEDDDDTILLYFHSKGMTSNQHETRQYLFKYTIENYMTYVNEFKNNKYLEVAGAIPHINGFIFFNFFLSRSSYIRNYCSRPEISDNRYIWEVWIGNEFSRKKEIITYSPIIKYDQVKEHHEVWSIHDKMVKNHYCHLLNTVYINPETIDIEYEDESPTEINSDTVLNNSVTKKSVKFNLDKPVISKPIRIDPSKIDQLSKPVRIDKKTVTNEPIKTVTKNVEITEQSNELNPYTIFEKFKNKNDIVIEIGASIGLNTYMLSKRFKKVVVLEDDKSNLERLESNIRKFCYKNISLCKKRLVQIKNDLNNDITLKEL